MIDVHEMRYILCETLVALIILFLICFRGTRGRKIVTTFTIFCDHKVFQILGGPADPPKRTPGARSIILKQHF